MNFKDLLQTDAKAFTDIEEFGEEVEFKGVVIPALVDEVADEILDGMIMNVSVATLDVQGIAKGDLFTIRGSSHMVLDFTELEAITDIVLNKVS
jgi:hypothetical protein